MSILIPNALKAPWFEDWAQQKALDAGYRSWHAYDKVCRRAGRSLFDQWFMDHCRLHGELKLADQYETLPRNLRDMFQAKMVRLKNQVGMRFHNLVKHDSIVRVGKEIKTQM